MQYKAIVDRTPQEMRCFGGIGCPSLYEGSRDLTPRELSCGVGGCPSIYGAERKNVAVYLIVGKVIDPASAGLEKKVGDGEVLIEVPRALIDNKER